MTAAHGQGPPRSTVADALAAIVAHYAATASRGAWAPGTSYAVGDTVGNGGALFACYAAGTSDNGTGPAGVGSQTDANGVGWRPVVYVGERYLRQHGAPPRIVVVPGNGEIGGPIRMGDGNVASDAEEIRAFVWAAESPDDIGRYVFIEAMKDAWINMIRKIMPGRAELRTVNPTLVTNVVTFGEDRQLVAVYKRSVPRDAAIWSVPVTPLSPPDPARPNGDTGTIVNVTATATPTRA